MLDPVTSNSTSKSSSKRSLKSRGTTTAGKVRQEGAVTASTYTGLVVAVAVTAVAVTAVAETVAVVVVAADFSVLGFMLLIMAKNHGWSKFKEPPSGRCGP
jgi:hypothetical protein